MTDRIPSPTEMIALTADVRVQPYDPAANGLACYAAAIAAMRDRHVVRGEPIPAWSPCAPRTPLRRAPAVEGAPAASPIGESSSPTPLGCASARPAGDFSSIGKA